MEDIKAFGSAAVTYVKQLLSKTTTIDAAVAFVGVLLGFYLNWPLSAVLAFGLLIWTILNPVSSRVAAKGATGLLVILIALLAAGKADRAESVAALAYYFLVITVIMAIFEIRRGASDDDQPKN